MIRELLCLYRPGFARTLVYMLQSTEYQPSAYIRWIWRTRDYSAVMRRRTLDQTRAARLLLVVIRLGMLLQIALGLLLIYLDLRHDLAGGIFFGLAVIIFYPILWAHLAVLPLLVGRLLVNGPTQKRAIAESEKVFAKHPGVKIAVAGSYGKTTMKELLNTVLSEGLKVAATPANKNVAVSHAAFARQLKGDEDVLIIEYGEGAPGDVASFARITHPTHAVITGLAPAHLDRYKTLRAAGEDIFSVADYVKPGQAYVNRESPESLAFIKDDYQLFDTSGALGWKVSGIKVGLEGTTFVIKKDKQSLELESGLVGRHQVGFLALVAALALEMGLTKKQVQAGIAKTKSFEHRMQPYALGGAWIIDDSYNGNLEGIRAGTSLLKELDAKRKIYVTPGLVDQGEETARVHREAGQLIAEANPDLVVLMKNSVTDYIKQGLEQGKYQGELQIEDNPLEFYTNLNHFVASGDLVLMQNDWTDNYA